MALTTVSDEALRRGARPRDLHRPVYHFLPAANWLNDPNGLIQWQGQYHLFYQYNPHGPFHGTIHWGHAVSEDLVHWTDWPVALAPSPDGPDADGCWSGCAVDNDGVPTLIYTGSRAGRGSPCVATSGDGLRTWQKYAGNPVIAGPPPGLAMVGFRDHAVWQEGATWYQVIGAGIAGRGGAALLYRSPDLLHWEYLGPLCTAAQLPAAALWTGSMWECPSFFALAGRHVLVLSVWHEERLHYSAALLGRYAAHTFVPETAQKLDYGDRYYYAPQTMLDDQGRRLIWAWIPEGRPEHAQRTAGWAGVMSLPRILALGQDDTLRVDFAPELAGLRGEHLNLKNVDLTPGMPDPLQDVDVYGAALEILLELEPAQTGQCVLEVLRSPDGTEVTRIIVDWERAQIEIDRRQASLEPQVETTGHRADIGVLTEDVFRLHLFVDHSVLELIANGRTAMTTRVYPTRSDSSGVALFATGDRTRVRTLDLWRLASIW